MTYMYGIAFTYGVVSLLLLDSNLRPSDPKALLRKYEINQYFLTITRVYISEWNEFESQHSTK